MQRRLGRRRSAYKNAIDSSESSLARRWLRLSHLSVDALGHLSMRSWWWNLGISWVGPR
jgi:hypothetical protein